ncbi:MAG: cysteine--tRNA ligase [Candidatus Woesearchaeota archaeon]
MPLEIYNTQSRTKEAFKPLYPNKARIYACGPTVNDIPHLGHARQQITYDILRRYLKFIGYEVTFVSNITDIDDKIINKARESNEDIASFTEKNLRHHLEDYQKIGVEKPDVQPRATEYIKQMIELISILEDKGFVYIIPDDGVYYDISKFEGYGKLSHQNVADLMSGARVESKTEKRNKEDFVLWKFSKPGEPEWDSPWGKGRPGWHIECSAMSASILGLPIDIHGGGQDLIFPHHEDELAQSEAAYGKKLANYWMHNGMVNVDKVKMSKSLGNFRTIRDLLKEYDGEVIRFFVISAHYRKPIDFSKDSLSDAKISYERLKNLVQPISDDGKENIAYIDEFKNSMDEDLNTSKALALLWNIARDSQAIGRYDAITKIDSVLGLKLFQRKEVVVPEDVLKLVELREQSRKTKDWKVSDELRKEILSKGYTVSDSIDGPKITKI